MKLELTTYGFEKYLEEKCFEDNPTVLDDDMLECTHMNKASY